MSLQTGGDVIRRETDRDMSLQTGGDIIRRETDRDITLQTEGEIIRGHTDCGIPSGGPSGGRGAGGERVVSKGSGRVGNLLDIGLV